MLFALLLIAAPPDTLHARNCRAAPGAPALDHAIVAVRDLDRAAAGFAAHGFRIKSGRLHANGLLNRHVKFRDATGIELMTVRGPARDAMAEDYARLIGAEAGGVYVGLTVGRLAHVERAAEHVGLASRARASGPWRFVSFAPASAAAAVFFGTPGPPANDPDSLVAHELPAAGLAEAWVEGGSELGELVARLGAARCGVVRGPDGLAGARWALARGALVVVPPAQRGRRPRVLGVVLRGEAVGDTLVRPHRTFWIRVRGAAR